MALTKEQQRGLLRSLSRKRKEKGRSKKSDKKKTTAPQVNSETDLEKLLRDGKITKRQYRLRKSARAEVDRHKKNAKDRKKVQSTYNSSTEKQDGKKNTVSTVANDELKEKYKSRDSREQKGTAKKTQLSKMLRRKKLTPSQYKLKMDEVRNRLKMAKATRRQYL
jgi:hypothetical protein